MLENLTGKKFGKLTVISEADTRIRGQRAWHCKCECGTPKDIENLEELLKAVGSKNPLTQKGKISEDGWNSYEQLRKILKFLNNQNVIKFNEDRLDNWIDDVNNSDI